MSRDTIQRVQTAAVLIPILLYMLFWGPAWLFPSVTALVACFAAYELGAMVAPGQQLYGAYQIVSSMISFVLVLEIVPWLQPIPTLAALVVLGMLFTLMQPEPIERAALRLSFGIAGPLYVGGLFGLIARVFSLPYGGGWVMLMFLCSFLSDTAGYFAGRHLGKHKLAPRVSPKKTVEGAVGGLLASTAGAILASLWFLPVLSIPHAILLAPLATALGQLGDLAESLIKRSTGVKDSGSVLPGHGGMLDRSDALLFAGSLIWFYAEHLL